MKLVLNELFFVDTNDARRGLEVLNSRQLNHLFGFIELEIDAKTVNLIGAEGWGVPIQAFCSNLKRLRDWLSIPGSVKERKFTTHAIGGYVLRFRLSGESVTLTVRENGVPKAKEISESLTREAATEALRAFRHELRSRMLKEAPTEAAEHFWKVAFAANINEDPYS